MGPKPVRKGRRKLGSKKRRERRRRRPGVRDDARQLADPEASAGREAGRRRDADGAGGERDAVAPYGRDQFL